MNNGTRIKKLEEIVDFVLDIKEDRPIKILQLTDTQIIDAGQCRYDARLSQGEKEKWATNTMEENAFKYMRDAITQTDPDLIVLTGDNVYGEFDDTGRVLERFIQEMDSYQIPWCSVFGNHDNETERGIDWTVSQYENARYSIFKRGNVEGNSNYTLGITANGKLKNVLFMVDTNGCVFAPDESGKTYKCAGIYPNQLKWFEAVNKELKAFNGGIAVPNMIFAHITIRGFADALCDKYGYISLRHEEYMCLDKTFKPITVAEDEVDDMGCMNTDFGSLLDFDYQLLNLAKEYGTIGFFFGHEHKNNISVVHNGIRFTYGTKTGTYDSNIASMLGGTQILAYGKDMKVSHVYYKK